MNIEQLNASYQSQLSKLFEMLCENMIMAGNNQSEYDNAIKRYNRGLGIAFKAFQIAKASTVQYDS